MLSSSAFAAVSAEEAKQLGTTLTLWGAEKAGNKEGTIPAYVGEKIKPLPAGWDVKKQGYPNPYASEKPLFSITAQNAAQYADKINGMVSVFKRYPTFRMDVYPSHRNVNFDNLGKRFLDNTVMNATVCKGADDELRLDGCYPGVPFPIPKTGKQAMWNRLMVPGSFYAVVSDRLGTWVIPTNGQPSLQTDSALVEQLPVFEPAMMNKVMHGDDGYFYTRIDVNNPPRAAGSKYIFKYQVDMGKGARSWTYIPGQRRVKLSPDLAYDTPSPLSGGAQLMDESQGFIGSMDRFDFKLVGKKEKYIMYNNFDLTQPGICPNNKVMTNKNFANPDCVRWELHRVWAVEATLRPGFRHAYHRRMFYWDEDTTTGSAEGYDASGELYRVVNIAHYPFPEGGYIATTTFGFDLLTGIWTYQGATGSEGGAWYQVPGKNAMFYSPENLAGEGIR